LSLSPSKAELEVVEPLLRNAILLGLLVEVFVRQGKPVQAESVAED